MSDERPDSAVLLKALLFAADKHSGDRRKGADKSPYINHPILVAHLLADTGGITDVRTLTAAVLHDTLEDTETAVAELDEHFGSIVRKLVQEVTDEKSDPKDVRKQAQIDHAPHLSARAKAIKIADKIANVRDVLDCPPGDWSLGRRLEYVEWTTRVVEGCRGVNAPLEKLYDTLVERGRRELR